MVRPRAPFRGRRRAQRRFTTLSRQTPRRATVFFFENANVPNEIGVEKNSKNTICKVTQSRVSRRQEDDITEKHLLSKSLYFSIDFAFRVFEDAILANTAHSDVLRRTVAKTSAGTIRNEGRKHDMPQTPRTATF